MAASMLENAAVVPLTGKADCGAIVELIPEIVVLSALSEGLPAAVAEDSVVCAGGVLSCG